MSNTLNGHEALLTLKRELAGAPKPKVCPYKPVEVGDTYTMEKYKQTSQVYVHDVKKDQVVLKRHKDAADSFTESRARFDKYYKKA